MEGTTLSSFEFVSAHPRRRHGVVLTCSRGRLDFTFADLVLELPVLPKLGWSRTGNFRITCARQAHFHHRKDFVQPKRGSDHDANRLVTGC